MNNDKQALLSICIPTWNRSQFLRHSLSLFQEQLENIDQFEVEFLISDNCSTDDTPLVVEEAIRNGMNINYSRNEENIGAGRNFLKCIYESTGKYIWLMGDDDYLQPNALNTIINILRTGDYGLIHLRMRNNTNGYRVLDNHSEFLEEMSYWSTFMSGNIFTRSCISKIQNPEQYVVTHLVQLPYYLQSSVEKKQNVIVDQLILYDGADANTNGGYNFFEVFIIYYLGIWKSFVDKGLISQVSYDKEKKHIFLHFIQHFMCRLLFLKEKTRLQIDNAWKILFKYYGKYLYFYKVVLIKGPYWIIKKYLLKPYRYFCKG